MKNVLILLAAALPGLAAAEGAAVTGKLGTLGLGIEVSSRINDDWNSRVGFNAFNYSTGKTESGIDYDFKLKLQTLSMIADYFPGRGSQFRLSLGLMYDNNQAGMTAKPTAGNYTINNVAYTAAQVGSLKGDLHFNKGAPYLGIGFGNPVAKGAGWNFMGDLGFLYQGKPKVKLNVTCGTGVVCATLQSNVAAEQGQAESAISGFRWYPVVSIGAAYQF